MLIGFFVIAALCCLAYYVTILCYAGITTSAAILWLGAAIAFLGAALISRFYFKYPDRIPLWMPVSAATLLLSGVAALLSIQGVIYASVPELAIPGIDYVIVLGAGVKPGGMTITLQKRLDKAAEYVEENPDTILVLSGGQGRDEHTSEASAMSEYLIAKGVPRRQLLLEAESASTLENIVYSYHLIMEDREAKKATAGVPVIPADEAVLLAPDKPLQIGIVTNNFHLYRARMIAQKRGIEHVTGIAAGSDPVLLVHLSVRECIAILKERLVGNI